MPSRHDSLPKPKDTVGLRLEVRPETRDRLRTLAAGHGYSMASFLRLLIEHVTTEPGPVLRKIPKNTSQQS